MATPAQSFAGDGFRLYVEFIETFLGVTFKGFQSGFGFRDDLILFDGPGSRATLAVPTSTMLLPQEQARSKVQEKIAASAAAFAKGAS